MRAVRAHADARVAVVDGEGRARVARCTAAGRDAGSTRGIAIGTPEAITVQELANRARVGTRPCDAVKGSPCQAVRAARGGAIAALRAQRVTNNAGIVRAGVLPTWTHGHARARVKERRARSRAADAIRAAWPTARLARGVTSEASRHQSNGTSPDP